MICPTVSSYDLISAAVMPEAPGIKVKDASREVAKSPCLQLDRLVAT